MKLLIDQNISHRLKARIVSAFPDIFHVKDLGLTDFPDSAIFETARRDNFDAVLTLDEDFHNLVLERGVPPTNNMASLEELFYSNSSQSYAQQCSNN